ncbi:hypothetical protein DERF_008290 [Dermatophagoides farinae]|uniref:Uncharacterized protein n=1 Tax=Dermatophagoides farinae TaxID=6954 RepID=A0A922I447_DERFA|nr:hypothetical protein DERF_008290 [Dermatophagoides farinae]
MLSASNLLELSFTVLRKSDDCRIGSVSFINNNNNNNNNQMMKTTTRNIDDKLKQFFSPHFQHVSSLSSLGM